MTHGRKEGWISDRVVVPHEGRGKASFGFTCWRLLPACVAYLTCVSSIVILFQFLLGGMDMKITTKGQVTIPQEIRDKMGLLPHSEVEFVVEGNVVVLRKVANTQGRGKKIIDRMRGRATVRMSTDEIMALTRGDS